VSLPEISTIQNVFRRIAGASGFNRRAKDVTPTIAEYLSKETADGQT
jgi:hypothetical protein